MSSYRVLLSGAAKRILVPIVGVLALAPLPAVSAAPQPAESTVALDARAFSVSFPIAQPAAKNYFGPNGILRAWFGETKAGLFIAADMPRSGSPKAAVERLVASFEGKLVSVKGATVEGAPEAIRYVFSLSGGENGEGVLAPVGDHVYGALALTAAKDEPAAARFVASLAVPAAAKAAVLAPLPAKVRTKALSAKAFDTGEHLAAALLVDPVNPAVLALKGIGAPAARGGARAGAVRTPVQIASADDPPQSGIPDTKPDVPMSAQQAAQQRDAFGAAIASIPPIPDAKPDANAKAVASAARAGARAGSVRMPMQIALADDPRESGIPDTKPDVPMSAQQAAQQRDAFGAAIASIPPIPDSKADVKTTADVKTKADPDTKVSTDAAPDAFAPPPPPAHGPPLRIASRTDVTASPIAASDHDGIPDPHADLGNQIDGGTATQQDNAGAEAAPIPDARRGSDAMLDDVDPSPSAIPLLPKFNAAPTDLQPPRNLQPPRDLDLTPPADQPRSATASSPPPTPPLPFANPSPPAAAPYAPPPRASQLPPGPAPYPPPSELASQLPPAAAPYPTPARWIWLPDAWRWNGYSWQLVRGRWARAAD